MSRIALFRIVFIFVVMLGLSCGGNPLPQPYIIEDLRIVTILAEPPEVLPGQKVHLTAYYANPTQLEENAPAPFAQWNRCPGDDGISTYYDCTKDGTEIRVETPPVQKILPGLYRSDLDYEVAKNILQNKPPLTLAYGFYETLLARVSHAEKNIDAFKRVVVNPKPSAVLNRNPLLEDVRIYNEQEELVGAFHDLSSLRCQTKYYLEPVFADTTLETYTIIDYNQNVLTFTEEASLSWSCSSSCELEKYQSKGRERVGLKTPENCETYPSLFLHSVMRDGRGGTSYRYQKFLLK